MSPSILIHGASPSPFVRKVRVVAFEKQIDYELRPLLPLPKTPELLAMNPLGKIPILEHGDLVVPDSSVICAYLERLQPEPRMWPVEPVELARALWLEEFADTRLSEGISPAFFERFVKPKLMDGEPDEAIVSDALEKILPPALDYLESQLDGSGTLLPGGLSIADAAVGAQLQGLALVRWEIEGARWPRLARYAGALLDRPSFQKALA